MVRLEEVEDETYSEKPQATKDGALLVDDDADYTDTGTRMLLVHVSNLRADCP